ncbi:SsrA-binding protein SmpB [Candidatus Nardonella dryophthoridicola]|uniref:SsrA-binding protein SmpB n=1 Tax=Candidatus Nardonella dryophthoridicola TaxID=1971485 RepID=UPI001AD8695D|nr:SsrA-binding protein SmpB [Candidatus Nardonella dryophthoridicola]QTJ62907.1 SsrA-binding protein SmpB [Candidatus Nardonella dryophthoridicola]
MNKLYSKLIKNKNILYNYSIKYKIECGIVLKPWEVKSFVSGNINIKNSYIVVINKEIFLRNSIFNPINNNFLFVKNDDLARDRKLLLRKNEIFKIYNDIKISNMVGIILSIYFKNKFIKVNLGISKGKKKVDIRNKIKERDWNIKKNRIYKSNKID